ncbi:LOW QUALITY PROTEIN: protein indeterminate-domain 2-like [Chenopodium quinoa]|uniref:LOW QUALITY PROTEIN: protein indeterminate-domain 2-like n=1 Tax=Chenopodium quinoa TaxID=63459 RepID=UPI000B798F45|nr:LOW QUALITY PROTEIN: protein indeterminate-domain 2-like [Chenopodium quinoa]
MPADLDDSSAKTMSNNTGASGEASVSSSGDQTEPLKPPTKKKRNQPGMPDPDAEVIALSPKTLMATNRFVCEICNKGFQRDQNLQLHRRGHNLPWKLRQRSSKEVKKRVYVCPEISCVHHDPSRALGDLTGIKKHFCRKHGEKKWKCEKCSKKYAVQSDWKAHIKICGTREYKCDCGTLFSRRDSFITHRAFCDALAEESARNHPNGKNNANNNSTKMEIESKASAVIASPPPAAAPPQPSVAQQMPPPSPLPAPRQSTPPPPPAPTQSTPISVTPATTMVSSVLPIQSSVQGLPESHTPVSENVLPPVSMVTAGLNGSGSSSSSCSSSSGANTSSSVFATLFASSSAQPASLQSHANPAFSDFIQTMTQPECPPSELPQSAPAEPISLCLATNHGSSIFGPAGQERRQYAPLPQPAMSATALLQKAAQMGANGGSLLRGLGLVSSTSSAGPSDSLQWTSRQVEPETSPVQSGLGLGLPCDEGSGLKELMIGSSSMFGPKQPTLDFLGLGMAAGGSPNGGLSALITSMGNGLDVAAAAASFGGPEFAGKDIGRSS